MDNRSEALAYFERGRDLALTLERRMPGSFGFRFQLALAYYNLAIGQRDDQRRSEAIVSCRKSGELFDALPREQPNHREAQRALSLIDNLLGLLLVEDGHSDEALPALQRSYEVMSKLADEDPGRLDYQLRLAAISANTALAWKTLGSLPPVPGGGRRAANMSCRRGRCRPRPRVRISAEISRRSSAVRHTDRDQDRP